MMSTMSVMENILKNNIPPGLLVYWKYKNATTIS